MRSSDPVVLDVSRRQLLDAGGIKPGERFGDRDALDLAMWRNLGERRQHKGAFEQMRMRQGRPDSLISRASNAMISISRMRGPQRRSLVRSRPNIASTRSARSRRARGVSAVSTTIARLMKGGCSATPHGGVR